MVEQRRGRPTQSIVRDNLIELLYFMRESYGYDLYKIYSKVFDHKISMRLIYYHLNKGLNLGLFNIKEIQKINGDYSWGNNTKRVIFTLGANATPKGSNEIYEKINKIKRK